MRFFVASWFFPPSTSSEGIVTYKLFRNSRHTYDVCSSQSSLWSYDQVLPVEADNITVYPIDTDEMEVWVEAAVKLFEEKHAEAPYDAIMTRSMPPESIEVARRIREKYPEIGWVASIADPIAKMPYELQGMVIESQELTQDEKGWFMDALKNGCEGWKTHHCKDVVTLCLEKDVEDYALNNANALIFPCHTLKSYVLGTRRRTHPLVVPHTFDKELIAKADAAYEKAHAGKTDASSTGGTQQVADASSTGGTQQVADASSTGGTQQVADASSTGDSTVGSALTDAPVTLTFLGHSDALRSLEPIVRAMAFLRENNPSALDKLRIRLIGNVPENIRSLIYNYYLYDYIWVEKSVDYLTSLAVMQHTDWLIHVDAKFEFLKDTGYSIFFAGKIADYMGTDKPILALTGKHSPAYDIVKHAGGLCVDSKDIADIAEALIDIAERNTNVTINRAYRDLYDAKAVAKTYDDDMDRIFGSAPATFDRKVWPEVPNLGSCKEKFLSICVPSYNVACTLDRTLHSLLSSEVADMLEIFVVNDGSKDATSTIGAAYEAHYPTIVHVINKENGGHGSTINAALKQASGLYFRVLDGDDWVDGINLSKTIKTMIEKQAFADIVSSNYDQVYESDGHLVHWMKKSSQENYVLYDFETNDFPEEYFTIHSMMAKTDVLREAHFEIQEHTFYVDCEYILFPVPFAKTVMFTPEFIYRYDVGNPDQSINPDKFVARYDHHDRVVRRMLKYYVDMRPRMTRGQASYMHHLFLEEFLRTHYTLSLLWDSDKQRGFERAKDFDEFFKETDPELYAEFSEKYPGVKAAQTAQFVPENVRGLLDSLEVYREVSPAKERAIKAGKKLAHSRAGEVLKKSRCARAIAYRVFH